MRHFLGVGDTSTHATLPKELSLQRMPQSAYLVLAAVDELDLDRLAALADNICEVVSPTVIAVSKTLDDSAVLRLEERIEHLDIFVATLQMSGLSG